MRETARRALLVGVVASFALAAAGCGGGGAADPESGDGPGDGSSIAISGSSTVEPISARVAEQFARDNPDVGISVDGPGTGDGFQLFCAGETDISDASRPIRDEERQLCEQNGVSYTELEVAIDGITVMTNPANDAVTCLSFRDLYALVGPESEGFQEWSDANELAGELAGTVAAPYPDAPLTVVAPGEESGTYDTFVELAIEPVAEERGQDGVARADYQASPNDNVIIQGMSGSETPLGWVGYAFYVENQDSVRAIDVAGADGTCVTPTDETIASGAYPLSRPLFIYVNDARAEEEPALRAYVDTYLSDVGLQAIADAGYVRLTDAAWEETVAAWNG